MKGKTFSYLSVKYNIIQDSLKYLLSILLQLSSLAKSVYYYTLSKINKDDKNKEIIENIHHIKELLVKLLIT